jgi:hypothetical protein
MSYAEIPTHRNREFFATQQGIKSRDQGIFHPDQRILISGHRLAFAKR